MINSETTVVLEKVNRQVVRLTQGSRKTVIEQTIAPRFQVLSVGLQGPVGTVAENVLSMAASAVAAAETAETVATQANDDLEQLVNGLSNAIAYQSGVFMA